MIATSLPPSRLRLPCGSARTRPMARKHEWRSCRKNVRRSPTPSPKHVEAEVLEILEHKFLTTEGFLRLGLLSLSCLLPSVVLANTDYYRHVVFDNSPPADTYFYSEGSANGPSFLEQKNWRLPVETRTFLTPPTEIR